MGEKFSHSNLRFRQFLDRHAERWLERFIPQLNSEYLTVEVLNYHDVEGRAKRMVDLVNLVIMATQHNDEPVGFIAAQVDCDQSIAILHMVYVLPDVRRRGASRLLIETFESVMKRLDVKTIVAGVASVISRDLFREISAGSSLSYDIKEASVLRPGVED